MRWPTTPRVFLPLLLGALVALPAAAATLVVEGGTVHPVSGEPFVGRVVIEDGTITAAGPDAAAPAGATTIDAQGLHVYPGWFDALSQLGLIEINSVPATDDQSELGVYNPHLQAATAIHPASEVIPVARANGVTHSLVAPDAGSDGVVVGQAALVHLDGWTIEEMAIDDSAAMVVHWPEIETRRFDFATFSVVETPFAEAKETAEKRQNELRDWFDAARHYAKAQGSERLERNLELEALVPVVEGRQRVVVMAQSKRDIESAVAWAEAEGIEMVLAGGREAVEVADLLAEKQIPVILGFVASTPRDDDDPYDDPYRLPAKLAEAGVELAFASGAGGGFGPGGPHASRTLPYEVAMAVAFGLDRSTAIAALTLAPAEMLGVGDRLGSIEPGKLANLVILDGDPFDIRTRVRHLLIAGREVSLDNRHDRLYELYRSR